MADLSVRLFAHASLCSFKCVLSLHLVFAYVHFAAGTRYLINYARLLLSGEGVLYLGEKTAEGGTGLKDRSDAKVLTHPPGPLANACYVWEKGYWELLGFFVIFVARLSGCSSRRS